MFSMAEERQLDSEGLGKYIWRMKVPLSRDVFSIPTKCTVSIIFQLLLGRYAERELFSY